MNFLKRLPAAALALAALFLPAAAQAQPAGPRIGYVYPAGGKQGSTFQVVAGGQALTGATNVYVSGSGVQAAVLEYVRPLTQKEFMDLKEKLKDLQEKRVASLKTNKKRGGTAASPWTDADDKAFAEIKKKLLNPPIKFGNPAIAENVILEVTMAANAEPGQREIRLGTPLGLSNPLVFCVGQLPEFSQKAGKAVQATKFNREPGASAARAEMRITLPAVVNGQIMPGAADRFRFNARKGQRLVLATAARQLIPYLPDAVPGWFQATLALYDAKGKELAYDDDFRFSPDPVLYYEIPADGDYAIEIKDSIYRGREDFVYRITLGELPFITSIFPLGGPAGAQTSVELKGWNLAVTNLTVDDKDQAPGNHPLSVRKGEQVSNLVPFAVDTLPEVMEKEPNNQAASAQRVTLPVIVNGRIDKPGDTDVFSIEGRAGSEIIAEVFARRLNSPLDSVLRLTDAAGELIAFNDDHEDKGSGLTTHHADSYLRAKLATNGTYYLYIADTQHQGGPEYAYRLRLSAPQPDFALRVVPSSVTVRGAGAVPITVYALRKDGFTNEITLALKDAPRGFTLSGGVVPANQDQIRLTLSAPSTQAEPIDVTLEGRATIQGRAVAHPAVPAEDMMQAFAYRHLVTAQELKVVVNNRWMPRTSIRLLGESPVRIPAGGTVTVQVATPSSGFSERVRLELSDPPEGITIKDVSPSRDGTQIVLESDAAKVKPGLKGNLIVNVFANNGPGTVSTKPKAKMTTKRAPLGALPAMPFEVVAK